MEGAIMSFQDVSKLPRWVKYTRDYTYVSAASTTASTLLLTLPSGGVVNAARMVITTAFTGGTVVAATMTVDAQGTGDIISSTSVITIPTPPVLAAPHYGNIGGTTNVALTIITTGGNTQDLTAGVADIYLLISNLE
jgi:hypothetical protein